MTKIVERRFRSEEGKYFFRKTGFGNNSHTFIEHPKLIFRIVSRRPAESRFRTHCVICVDQNPYSEPNISTRSSSDTREMSTETKKSQKLLKTMTVAATWYEHQCLVRNFTVEGNNMVCFQDLVWPLMCTSDAPYILHRISVTFFDAGTHITEPHYIQQG